MRNETRKAFNGYLGQIAALNGLAVGDVCNKFTVTPTAQQKLEVKLQQSSAFLGRINIIGVTEQLGEALGLVASSTIAGRTNTSGNGRRSGRDVTGLEKNEYVCKQTDYDTFMPYAKLDAWAKFPDFQTRISKVIVDRCALDRIMIGWNGTSRAATSDKVANPLLQDVNIGWLQKYRTYAAARVMAEGNTVGSGEVRIGAAAGRDYYNLDALVMDLVNEMIEPWYQEDTELVAVCGRAMLADKYFPKINQDQANSEELAAAIIVAQKRIGNLPAVRVPYFPANAVMVTRLDNLSIYWQEGARRRTVVDNAKRDRIENYESSNEAYVVEDYGCGAIAENIVGTWAPD